MQHDDHPQVGVERPKRMFDGGTVRNARRDIRITPVDVV